MTIRKHVVTFIVAAMFVTLICGTARAQLFGGSQSQTSSSQQHQAHQGQQSTSFMDKLDNIGRDVFGTVFGESGGRNSGHASHAAPQNRTRPSASGHQTSRSHQAVRSPQPAAVPTPARERTVRVYRPTDPAPATAAAPRITAPVTPTPAGRDLESQPMDMQDLQVSNPVMKPLHERLSSFRRSAFPETLAPATVPTDVTSTAPGTVPSQPSPAVGGLRPAPVDTTLQSPERSSQHLFPERPTPAVRGGGEGEDTDGSVAEEIPQAPEAIAIEEPETVLIQQHSPILSVETIGPRQISVGKPSSYTLTLKNAGDVTADEVVVYVDLPTWAEVLGAETSNGTTKTGKMGEPFAWHVGRLEGRNDEKLTLRIVPRESRPFELAVRWDYRETAQSTAIEVQQPQLEMAINGPKEVDFGKLEIFNLVLKNPGNGDAENVILTLAPLDSNSTAPTYQNLGTLAAGETRTIKIELTARQIGMLQIQVQARCDGGVRTQAVEKVVVRRAELAIEIIGPKLQFVGSESAYTVRVANPGNAAAKRVKLSAVIPPGMKYISGIEGAKVDEVGMKIDWVIDTIAPNAEFTFSPKVRLQREGVAKLEVVGSADGNLVASGVTSTAVEAMADLKMEVRDPSGPVEVGDDALYELIVSNAGSKTASQIDIVIKLSDGVKPISVDGLNYRIDGKRIYLDRIMSVNPGDERRVRIHVQGQTAGNHNFQAELQCLTDNTRLITQETTHFYGEPTGAAMTLGGGSSSQYNMPPHAASRPTNGSSWQAAEPSGSYSSGSGSSEPVPMPAAGPVSPGSSEPYKTDASLFAPPATPSSTSSPYGALPPTSTYGGSGSYPYPLPETP